MSEFHFIFLICFLCCSSIENVIPFFCVFLVLLSTRLGFFFTFHTDDAVYLFAGIEILYVFFTLHDENLLTRLWNTDQKNKSIRSLNFSDNFFSINTWEFSCLWQCKHFHRHFFYSRKYRVWKENFLDILLHKWISNTCN